MSMDLFSKTLLLIASMSLAFSCFAQSQQVNELKALIEDKGCIDNNILTEICKSGRSFIESHDDYNALNGAKVCLRFAAKTYSKSQKRLTGRFLGRSGAWAEEIFVDVILNKAVVPSGIQKGSGVFVSGNLLPDGNGFYGNAIDNCFIMFNAKTVEADGF